MKNLNLKKIKGYIEGYYGKLLTWDERNQIIDALHKNKMNFYFYCPKEDLNHRSDWRIKYNKKWMSDFIYFNNYALKKNVSVIVGISPGLDFNFKSYLKGNEKDLNFLKKKINSFLKVGVKYFSILYDDVPENSDLKNLNYKEGKVHANLVNRISLDFNIPIFAVPRIYSDELLVENPDYLIDFYGNLNKKSFSFYCGRFIVSKSFSTKIKVVKNKIDQKKIIYWDNFYCNDYCPKRLIIGPSKNKNLIEKTMINGTGLINTDKLILEIVKETADKKYSYKRWKHTLLRNNIPKQFFKICREFLEPTLSNQNKMKKIIYDKSIYSSIDFLLWKWKDDLSREWYNYILNFKHDLQILNNELSLNRILKTHTYPVQKMLIDRRN